MAVEVAGVEDSGELGATVLTVWTKVSVQFVQGLKLGVRGCGLVGIGGLIGDAYGVAVGSCLLQDGKEVRGKDDMGHMVHGHLARVQHICHDKENIRLT